MPDLSLLLGAASGAAITDVLVQYGALGAVALGALLAVRVLYQREAAALDLERTRRAEAEAELRKMNEKLQDQIIPILTEATRVISEVVEMTRERR